MAVNITDRSAVEALIREPDCIYHLPGCTETVRIHGNGAQASKYDIQADPYPRSGLPSDRILGGWRHRDEADLYAGMG